MGSTTCPGALEEGAPVLPLWGPPGVQGGRQPADSILNGLQPLTSPESTAALAEWLAALGHPTALSRSPRGVPPPPAGWEACVGLAP